MKKFKTLLVHTTALTSLWSNTTFASDHDSNKIAAQNPQFSLPSRIEAEEKYNSMVNLILNGKYKDTMDPDVVFHFEKLYSSLPEEEQSPNALRIVCEFADQFGYQFWEGLDGNNQDLLAPILECDQKDRLPLIRVINECLYPFSGAKIKDRESRSLLLKNINSLSKGEKVPRIIGTESLIKCILLGSNDKLDYFKKIMDYIESAKILTIDQHKASTIFFTYLIEHNSAIKNPRNIIKDFTQSLELSEGETEISPAVTLALPFLGNSSSKNITTILKVSPNDREEVIKYALPFKHLETASDIIEGFFSLSQDQRSLFAKLIQDFKDEMNLDEKKISKIIIHLLKINSQEKQKLVLNRLKEILRIQDTPSNIYYKLFPLLTETSDEQWNTLFSQCLRAKDRVNIGKLSIQLATAKEESRELAINRFIEFMDRRAETSNVPIKEDEEDLISEFLILTPEEWSKCLPPLLEITSKANRTTDIIDILETINSLSMEQLYEVSVHLSPFIKLMFTEYPANTLRMIEKLTCEEIGQIPPLLTAMREGLEGVHLDNLFRNAAEIPAENRLRYLNVALPYFKEINRVRQRSEFLRGLLGIDPSNLERVVSQSWPLLKTLYKNHSNITYYLNKISPDNLPDVIKLTCPYAGKIEDGMQLTNFIETFEKFNNMSLREMMELVAKYATDIKHPDSKIELITLLHPLVQEERISILELCSPIFTKIQFGHGKLAKNLSELPESERKTFLTQTLEFFENEKEGYLYVNFLDSSYFIEELNPIENKNTLKIYKDGYLYADFLKILNTIQELNQEENKKTLKAYWDFIKSFKGNEIHTNDPSEYEQFHSSAVTAGMHSNAREWIMAIFNQLPIDLLDKSINALKKLKAENRSLFKSTTRDFTKIISFLKSQNIISIESLTTQWRNFLKTNTNKHHLLRLAKYIENNKECYGLLEEDETVQEAIKIRHALEDQL